MRVLAIFPIREVRHSVFLEVTLVFLQVTLLAGTLYYAVTARVVPKGYTPYTPYTLRKFQDNLGCT